MTAVALAILLGATACSSSPPDMTALPPAAIAAISVGQVLLPDPTSAENVIVAFDANGDEVGRITGRNEYGSTVARLDDGLFGIAGNGAVVLRAEGTTLTGPGGRRHIVGSAVDVAAGHAMMWNTFDTTEYVLVSPDREPFGSEVPGRLVMAGHCDDGWYAGTAQAGGASTRVQLHRLPGPPSTVPVDLPTKAYNELPLVCAANGRDLITLIKPIDAVAGPTLVTIDSRSGRTTSRPLTGTDGNVFLSNRSVTRLDEDLYLIDSQRAAYRLPLSGSATTLRKVWQLPLEERDTRLFISADKVLAVTERAAPTYAEYDLRTGDRLLGPIPLPWLPGVKDGGISVTGAADVVRPS
ncbi:hypothetical protein SCNU_10099 [Gordonia neofelifaecis NRRL B-59395]|uniref:Uncharacterized protein n=1 Tax=Gordonia neofelifaecis NRRL B-59395 TaxID=644548 RepID=F1YJI3_9ACTN|nr:hypothetical protein SCNU_10099 [Gordonia neofelifaecis NRRL B-59395]